MKLLLLLRRGCDVKEATPNNSPCSKKGREPENIHKINSKVNSGDCLAGGWSVKWRGVGAKLAASLALLRGLVAWTCCGCRIVAWQKKAFCSFGAVLAEFVVP